MTELREEEEFRLVAGLQPVRELIRVQRQGVRRVEIDDRELPRLDALERFARDQGITDVHRVSRDRLDRVTRGTEHQGVVAWGPFLALGDWDEIICDPNLLAIALDRIQDPQNFGAIVRSSVAIAGAAVLFGENRAAPLTAATFRASAGAIEHARLCRVHSMRQALQAARDAGVEVIGLEARAPERLQDLPFAGPAVLVVGSEHEGLSHGVRQTCSRLASLPSSGKLDSLNASVAAGIALSLAVVNRERSKPAP